MSLLIGCLFDHLVQILERWVVLWMLGFKRDTRKGWWGHSYRNDATTRLSIDVQGVRDKNLPRNIRKITDAISSLKVTRANLYIF